MKDFGPTMIGRLQEMGSLYMRGNRADADTFLTSQMRKAGLNLIGRTTTPEFGVCSSAENPAVYITRNPWNTDYTTCGSSAGSAATHATDGGGSIRIPAGVNGNIGLKASRGVFSIAPHLSDLTGLVSIQGCQSRSVHDTAAFVDACRGPEPGEFMPYWTAPEPYRELIMRDPPQLRIAISHQWGDYRATPQIAFELERVGCFLESLGHRVESALPAVDYRDRVCGADHLLRQQFRGGHRQPARCPYARAAADGSHRAYQHPDLGERKANEFCRAGAHAGHVQRYVARFWRVL
jgi:Asp-tRNA(Asn)/Glu-tRNA(Gln) amidotransferase A subunit family amidase